MSRWKPNLSSEFIGGYRKRRTLMEWVRYHDIDDHFFHILRAVVCVIGAAIGFATYSYGEWTNNHGGAWWTAGAMGFGVVLIVASIVFALVTLFKWIGDEF